eukprot:304771-Pyramimonas_sp.AAC.1
MVPRGPQRAQGDLQDGSREPKMPPNGSEDVPRSPDHAPRRLRDASETSKEASKKAKSVRTPKANRFRLPSEASPKSVPRAPR